MKTNTVSAADLRAYVDRHWPAYLLISRKEANHAARLVEKRSGVTRLSAGSNTELRQLLNDPATQARLRNPPVGFGLELDAGKEVRRAELEKLQRTVNECVRETVEWLDPGDDFQLVRGADGLWRFWVNGFPVERTEGR